MWGQGGVRAEGLLIFYAESGGPRLGDAAVLQDLAELPAGDGQRLRVPGLLVRRGQLPQLGVNGLDHPGAAFLIQGLRQQLPEAVLLDADRHRRSGVKQGVDEFLVAAFSGAVIEQSAVDIRGAIIEGGKEKAQLRVSHRPDRSLPPEALFRRVIAEAGPGLLHGADGADQIGKLGVAAVRVQAAVLAPEGHVIDVRRQQDQIVGFRQLQASGDLLIQDPAAIRLGQPLLQKPRQQLVFRPVLDLSRGKDQV